MIKIKHLTGSTRTGEINEIDQQRVSLGRGPDNDVVFDDQLDKRVSSNHAEIYITVERLWIRDLKSSNGTYVNDRRINGPTKLRPGDVICLGENGSELVVSSPLASTRNTGTTNRPKKTSIGRGTLIRIVNQVGNTHRATSRRNLIIVVSVFIVIFGIAWYVVDNKNDEALTRAAEEARRAATDGARNFSKVFAKIEPSVYPVFNRKNLGGGTGNIDVKGGGTAWVVGKGILATNAHVATNFKKLRAEGGGLVIRTTGDNPQDILIDRVKLHPGYERWLQLGQEFNPFDKSAIDFLSLFPACDVALMYVKAKDVAKLGPPLELAPIETLLAIKRGDRLAFLGFSVEGNTTGTMNRGEASSDDGALVKAVDFFMEKTHPTDRHLLTYTLATTGGASGSPVLNREGEVIAVHSAGNYKFIGDQRISQGTTNAGQRADILRELIDGDAESHLIELEKAWRQQYLATWKRGHDPKMIFQFLAFDHISERFDQPKRKLTFGHVINRTVHLKPGEKKQIEFKFSNVGPWFIAAMPAGSEFHKIGINGHVSVKPGSWLALGLGENAQTRSPVTIEVFLSQDSITSADVQVGVFQL
ncbi:MAG: hypothetical protein ACI97A_000997 [Planctomycetota bacterium]|jgi:hypothetical protein